MSPTESDPYEGFPAGFFTRIDQSDDREFYDFDRFVTHIDDGAIAAVGALYEELGVNGRVLDPRRSGQDQSPMKGLRRRVVANALRQPDHSSGSETESRRQTPG